MIALIPALGQSVAADDRVIGDLLLACSHAAERGDFEMVAITGRAYREIDQRARTRVTSACRLCGES